MLVGLGYKIEVITHNNKLTCNYQYVFPKHWCPMPQGHSLKKKSMFGGGGATFGADADLSFPISHPPLSPTPILAAMAVINVTQHLQYIPRNMQMVFALLCFVVVIHWLIFPYPSGLLYWHCGNLTIAPVPAKQPWWIWINTSCEFIMNDCITTTKQSTTKPCAYFLGYTVVLVLIRTCPFQSCHHRYHQQLF